MRMREARVIRAGQRFVGRFRVTGQGDATSVMVCFETAVICARKGDLPEEEVAQTLLGELIQESQAERKKRRIERLKMRRAMRSAGRKEAGGQAVALISHGRVEHRHGG